MHNRLKIIEFFFQHKARQLVQACVTFIIIFSAIITLNTAFGQPNNSNPHSYHDRLTQPFLGDLDEMRERRLIRVLISYNRTHYFMAEHGKLGLEYEFLRAYEQTLNRGPLQQRYQTHLVFIPTPFDQLFDALNEGRGDIIAAGLTITETRKNLALFTLPYISGVNEILISHINAPHIERLEDLSGRRVMVVAQSSYMVNLLLANQALGRLGLQPIDIMTAPSMLDAEDILELVNTQIVDFTVADDHIAQAWSSVLPNLLLHPHIRFHQEGQIAWAVRNNNPQLLESLNNFIERQARPGRYLSNVLFNKYFNDNSWLETADITLENFDRLSQLRPYFELYADFYDLDWLLIAAVAFQESRFRNHLTSGRGAVGIMQIRPSTAAAPPINIHDINDLEHNIHAGTKYLAYLKHQVFAGPDYTAEESLNFALAAYNAGQTRVRQLQREAEREGLNPYIWFYNVEQIARRRIGHETVNYVLSVQRHKTTFTSTLSLVQERRMSRTPTIQTPLLFPTVTD
ncbi:transporter substrate-binding domain-containing protein [Thiomicrospira sp. ALE5]|uniref:transglycosylase SLT domain-containing protein n=1 Tax=Thiomicrospira sp. ALE5 TaxID=748650 RepID=UPI0008E5CC3A|nr:transporter substrate-binding domain-containing protein [Thiomicrospira sp. ALE5]SFR53055.1 Membrane-bound lytic murein transglycosylase MltF [Thiomicrospira sp. ALE5]